MRVLLNLLDPQPRLDQAVQDVTDGVLPLVALLVCHLGVLVSIGTILLPAQRLVAVPVTVFDPEGLKFVVEDPHQRMGLHEQKNAPRLQVASYDPAPPPDVLEPAQDPDAGEHDVILSLMDLGEVVDVAADELGVHPDLLRYLPGELDGGLAEVHPSRLRPEAGPADGVQPEVALEVEEALPRDVAEDVQLHPVQAVPARDEALEVVLLGLRVDAHKLVPACLVGIVVIRQGYPVLTRVHIEKRCGTNPKPGQRLKI